MRKVGKVSMFQCFKVSRFQGFKVSRFQGFKEWGASLRLVPMQILWLALLAPRNDESGAVGLEALWVLHVTPRRRVSCKDGQLVHDRTAFSLVILIVSLVFAMVRARSCPSDC